MTLEQLTILRQIVECGSIKAAAESLHKTQPALTMAIKKLEGEYGFSIFNRDQYRLQLTQAGKTFYRKSLALLSNADQLRSMGQHLGAGNEPIIHLAYDQFCPYSFIMAALKDTQEQYSGTEVHILGESRFRSLELLQKGEVDIAISPWWPTFYALGGVDTISIDTFKLVLVAAPSLLKGEEINELEQLRPYMELTSHESEMDFDSEKLTLVTGARQWKTRDSLTLKHMLMAGLGWGLVPEHLVARELREGALTQLHLNDAESVISGDVRAVRKQDKTPGPVASHLWECFKQLGLSHSEKTHLS